MKKIIIIDNYDSFTYNLVHAIQEIVGHTIDVVRNDQIDFELLSSYDYIVLSPGPGIPDEAGDLKRVIREYGEGTKMLGVCLGHQAIGEVYGAQLHNLEKVYHGVQTSMQQTQTDSLYVGIDSTFEAGRYHSWVIRQGTLSDDFVITSVDDQGEIMSMKHKDHHLYGVQFHPESILTPEGPKILENFLNIQ
ncbi:MAG: aminodeoxychorismate/anthranilate synthase component II [Bacteroidota bacterium]